MINKPVVKKLDHAFVHDVEFLFLRCAKLLQNARKRVNQLGVFLTMRFMFGIIYCYLQRFFSSKVHIGIIIQL